MDFKGYQLAYYVSTESQDCTRISWDDFTYAVSSLSSFIICHIMHLVLQHNYFLY
jgi:hypothetical protein